MQVDLTTLPPLPALRCRKCNKRFGDASFDGLAYFVCHRCKELNIVLDGAVLGAQPVLGSRDAEQADIPADGSDLLQWLEERWEALAEKHRWRRAQLAVGIRFKVFHRDGFKCMYCGRSPSEGAYLEADHVVPRSKGGSNTLDNLTTACQECNRGKSDHSLTGPTA